MNFPRPDELPDLSPTERLYPPSWRDAAIRALFDDDISGVRCPACSRVFRTRPELRFLQADHIRPWAQGGQTTWENLQLLCGPCNIDKSARLPPG